MEEGLGERLIEANPHANRSSTRDISKSSSKSSSSSTTAAVVLSTLVAVCGSFCYGSAAACSSPAESGIMEDLGLSLAAVIGGMIGAIASLWLDLGRLSIGFGVGIISYVVPVYIAEIAPKDHRGAFTSINQLKVGREKEFQNAWQRLRGENADFSEEASGTRDHLETSQQNSKDGISELFQRRYANPLIIVVGLMLLQQLGGISAMAYYSSSVFDKSGFSSSTGIKSIAILEVPAVVLDILLMDKAGRRLLLLVRNGKDFVSKILVYLIKKISILFSGDGLKELTPILVFIGFLVLPHNKQTIGSRLLLIGNVRNPMDYNVRDISFKCQGLSWKPGDFNQLVMLLASHIHFQLHDGMERSR
ncbi:hypothetical protein JRO89_XS04G0184300 [Xanthoceras sorbifolium]|uniref:Uncharacterized protein n=1 Tax=Xanthoceras sorbifolium TaxID=99658 RepID=A0ABQ8I6N0_9ROSI|nr:hypothetical protein JRO89_XS04G0184300 [Xanthoceras sorbifolium]